LNQPVIAAASNPSSGNAVGGLAGKVTRVTGGTAEVTLITDESSGVAAQIMPAGASGVVKPEVGNPRDMLLDFVEGGKRVTEGTIVVTSGFKASRVESLFPRGIPIGEVTKVDLDEVELYQRVHIRPFADLRRIDIVQVLTRKPPAVETAGVVTP
jgi:rod shape-determining protein MreC